MVFSVPFGRVSVRILTDFPLGRYVYQITRHGDVRKLGLGSFSEKPPPAYLCGFFGWPVSSLVPVHVGGREIFDGKHSMQKSKAMSRVWHLKLVGFICFFCLEGQLEKWNCTDRSEKLWVWSPHYADSKNVLFIINGRLQLRQWTI